MLLQFLILVFLKISLSNSYPLEENGFDSTTPEYESGFSTEQPKLSEPAIEIQDVWRLTALKDEIALVDSNKECRTSLTDDGGKPGRHYGQLDTPCKFPFKVKDKMYYTCTYDYSHLTGNKPWCSVDTDENNKHHSGRDRIVVNGTSKKFYGICDDQEHCNIPTTRLCGEPQNSGSKMPWLVSLGGYLDEKTWDHQCAGSLITNRHVLTSASCLLHPKSEWIYGHQIRFGTPDILNTSVGFERNIIHTNIHPDFGHLFYYDVGVAVADKIISFSDYVMPVCLPMTPLDDFDDSTGDLLELANWGFYNQDTRHYEVNSDLQTGDLHIYSKKTCNDTQLCIKASDIDPNYFIERPRRSRMIWDLSNNPYDVYFGSNSAKVCADDGYGSPAFKKISETSRGKPFYEQHYIASRIVSCKYNTGIYIRVTSRKVLPWIQKVTGSSPLLLVAGGFSGSSGGPINDIELISGEDNRACSRSIKPIFGRNFGTFNEGEALGMTGKFTKEAAIICGGKNKIENLNTCYEYNHTKNEWYGIPSMEEKRYYSDSALMNGNLWIIGGSDGLNHSKITEMYDYKPNGLGKWKKNLPLPTELQKSGISSHCVVTLNSSNVFMAGGYQSAYRIITNETIDEIEAPIAGGKTLSNSWMFDGSSWKALAKMSTPRDRPACSLMHMNDGSIRVLVAGGCKGWCVKEPGIASAEMYDPMKNTWTAIANLPIGLNSARMELLDGLPTIVGGYNGETQNGVLYQYHADLNQWMPHPDAQLRIPRSSPAVFQVPRHLFPTCIIGN